MLALAGVGTAFAASGNVSSADRNFVMMAAKANASEVAEGKVQRSSTEQNAATFARRMVTDHTKANDQLKTIATNLGLSSQFQQGVANAKPAKSLPGPQYLKMEIPDHQQAIALFRKEAANGTNPQLKAYAQKSLPVLEMHLDLAQKYAS